MSVRYRACLFFITYPDCERGDKSCIEISFLFNKILYKVTESYRRCWRERDLVSKITRFSKTADVQSNSKRDLYFFS